MSATFTRVWCSAAQQQPSSASAHGPAATPLQGARTTRRQQLCGALGALLLPASPAAAAAAAAAADDTSSSRRAETARIEAAYDGYAATYDELDGGAAAEQLGFPALRAALLAQARGDVLETAVGTGLNLPLYNPAALTSLTAVDLSGGMLAQARRRAAALGLDAQLPLTLLQADVEQLAAALDGRQFDTGAGLVAGGRAHGPPPSCGSEGSAFTMLPPACDACKPPHPRSPHPAPPPPLPARRRSCFPCSCRYL